MTSQPLINADRLWTRLMALAEIGATPAGGVNRQALSDGEIAAWRRVIRWAGEAGLIPSTDATGNLFLTLAGRDRVAPPLLLGSHLDSQPTGGKFDGAAGVMAALEAVVSLAGQGEKPMRDLIVVAWMNEEGSRFAPGMMGSEAFTGERGLDAIRAARDADGISVGEALDRLHAAFPDLPHRSLGFAVGAYLELHIEQGPVLEAADCTIGVVSGIQGKKTFQVVVEGSEGHAGTLAQSERRDALAAFARMASALHAEIGTIDADIKFTIGRVAVVPNAPSVVPSRVSFSIDLRHPDNAVLDAAGARIKTLCQETAPPCSVTVTPLVDAPSNVFDPRLRASIAKAAREQGHSAMAILSAAGHDARHLAKVCPAAMIFIPCRDGASHVEHEWAEPDHVAAGAAVLAQVLCELAFACHRGVRTSMQDVARRDYRDAMACLGAAVSIVTTDGGAGRTGFTASAICSVTDDPPTLLVCINRGSSAYVGVTRNKVVCINVLSARHEQLSRLFGGKVPAEERFAAAAWSTLATGAPVLADCAAAFDCRIADVVNVGTHDVLFCRVVALQRSGCTDNLIYFGRAYHTVGVTDPAEAGPESTSGPS